MILVILLTACDAFVLEPCVGRPWSSVSAGYQHVCALDNEGEATGEIVCSGAGAPVEVVEVPEGPWSAVTGGGDYACALDEDGVATCWGGSTYVGSDLPDAADGEWEIIDGGQAHVCAADEDGAVSCWGENPQQTAIPAELSADATALSAGFRHTCAIYNPANGAGPLVCWGEEGDWLATEATGTWKLVAAGADFTCAWDGSALSCWGEAAPDDLSAFDGLELKSLSAGALGVCGVTKRHELVCALLEPATLPEVTVQSVDLSAADAGTTTEGAAYGCALTTAGLLNCFGGGAPSPLPE